MKTLLEVVMIFLRKSLENGLYSNLIFRGVNVNFSFSSVPLLKRKTNLIRGKQKCKVYEKCYRLLTSKVKSFNFLAISCLRFDL